MTRVIKKVLKLLTRRERRCLYLLLVAMTVSGLVEVAGIASIMPFLSLITNPDLVQDNRILNWFFTTLNFQSINRFLILVGGMVLAILIVSNLLILFTRWGLSRFSWMRNYTISRRLLGRYLYQPYIFFLNQNTSMLGKNILSEVQQAITGVVIPLLEIFSSGIAALFIFIMLVVIEPILALFLLIILGGAYIFIFKLVKPRLSTGGKIRFKTNAERYKVINEAFGDIKLLKLTGSENFFLNSYSKPSIDFARAHAVNKVIGEIPRYIMEIIAFGGIIIVVLYLLATGRGFQKFLPLIGIYAFAIYRLMPSLQKIFSSITNMRFSINVLDILYEDMNSFKYKLLSPTLDRRKIEPLPLRKELRLERITFIYPETHKPVLDNINLKINVNTSVAFVGSTGAGKTTIANIILGLLRPDKGKILVDGIEVTDENLSCWQKTLGYIPQDIYLQDDTVAQNIAYGIPSDNIVMDAVEQAARIANINDFVVEEIPYGYKTVIGERGIMLSGGQRQRIGIARTLYHNPDVLVLDEATSALDGATEKEVFKAIENIAKTKTLIIIAHRLTTIQGCDVIYVLKDGKIIGQGKYQKLMESNAEFRKMARAHL